MKHEFNAKGCGCIVPLLAIVGLVLLVRLLAGCGDTFESQLFLEGETDGGISDVGAIASESGTTDVVNDPPEWRVYDSGQADTLADTLLDGPSSESSGDGDASDATPDTSDGMTCDPYQCQVTCASQGKLCSECECV